MKHYHFIGIGGIGMSGLAKILIEKGNQVSGSDLKLNKQTEGLEKLGAKIYIGHDEKNISEEIDFVIVSSAIKPENPEAAKAKELGLQILTRSELLNQIITTDHKAIAVTGTHGKTTTSGMIATILEKAGLDPTATVGADVRAIKSNAKSGKGAYSIAEVCEYQRAFLDVFPHIGVITNIEEDHLDCYKDLDDIIAAFADFITHIDKDGFLVAYGEDKNIDLGTKDYKGRIISYGQNYQNDWYLTNFESLEDKTIFEVIGNGQNIGTFTLKIPGIHNALNALAAIVVSKELGIETKTIINALADFSGAERRFEVKGEKNGAIFIDDYGHHPTEIQATLAAARQFYPKRRIIAVFQPHQHSRTKFLLEDFSKSFNDADIVLVPEIYAVRDTEEDIKSVSSKDLVEKINRISSEKSKYFKDFDDTIKHLSSLLEQGDAVITIGAGPVVEVAEKYLKLDKSNS